MTELILSEKPLIRLIQGDCMEFMSGCNAEQFDLSVVDPPYFDGPQRSGYYKGTKQRTDVGEYKDLSKSWEIPDAKYFELLDNVSKNQIIWGINYFPVCKQGGRIVWIKGAADSPFSMADIAYQSFYNRIDLFNYTWSGFWQQKGFDREERFHPTQKPVALYKWLLSKYAKPGDTILDTHGGSMSSVVAAYDMGFDITCIELDKDYFDMAVKRIKRFLSEPKIDFSEPKHGEQTTLI